VRKGGSGVRRVRSETLVRGAFLRLRLAARSGRRDVTRDAAQQAFDLPAFDEAGGVASHDLAPGGERRHVAAHRVHGQPRGVGDFGVKLFTAVLQKLEDFLQADTLRGSKGERDYTRKPLIIQWFLPEPG